MNITKKKHKNQQRTPRHTTDPNGMAIVKVPLYGLSLPVTLYADDFQRILQAEYSHCWHIKYTGPHRGYAYVWSGEPGYFVPVARLVVEAGPRQIVSYRDGDRLNLRRDNLRLERGYARIEANTRPAEDAYEGGILTGEVMLARELLMEFGNDE